MWQRAPVVFLWLSPFVVAAALVAPTAAGEARSPAVPTGAALPVPPVVEWSTACPVTEPNGTWPPGSVVPEPHGTKTGGYGNDALWTNLWMWAAKSEVPVPSTHVLPDGSFGEMKWAWYRYEPGRLTIEGRRLDAPAPPLRARIPDGYGESGFQVSGLIFPTGGCWEVTGRLGEASLTFVTLIVPPETVGEAGGSSLARGGQDRSTVVEERADT